MLAAWRDGDREAGEALFERHYRAVARFFANKITDRDIAADLVQRTFVCALEAAPQYKGAGSFRAFLFTIAYRRLYNYFAQLERGRPLDEYSSVAALQPGLSSVVSAKREQRMLLEALRSLKLDQQVVLELFYWEDLTGAEIAEVLGIPQGTVRTRLRAARKELHATLQRFAEESGHGEVTTTDLLSWARDIRKRLES